MRPRSPARVAMASRPHRAASRIESIMGVTAESATTSDRAIRPSHGDWREQQGPELPETVALTFCGELGNCHSSAYRDPNEIGQLGHVELIGPAQDQQPARDDDREACGRTGDGECGDRPGTCDQDDDRADRHGGARTAAAVSMATAVIARQPDLGHATAHGSRRANGCHSANDERGSCETSTSAGPRSAPAHSFSARTTIYVYSPDVGLTGRY